MLPKEISPADFEALVAHLGSMIEESGDPSNFDARHWLSEWLSAPLPALGGRAPNSYMEAPETRQVIYDLLSQSQSGAYT